MSFYYNLNNFIKLVVILSVFLGAAGCVSSDMTDLEKQVSTIMSKPGGELEPLPQIKPYEAYVYLSLIHI